jgi:acetate kinase
VAVAQLRPDTSTTLVVNVGSSSMKLRWLDGAEHVCSTCDLGPEPDDREFEHALGRGAPPTVVVHRIVHGGPDLHEAAVVDDAVLHRLEQASRLAPLHNPPALHLLRRLLARLPDATHIVCLDTAFHATMPDAASTYAVPEGWRSSLGVRRYGFHGLSHAHASRRAAEMLGRPVDGLRMVTAHLGAGASLAAVVDGRSVDTTMGFTPLEGLVMATRSGDLDPGAVLWVQQRLGLSASDVEDVLNHRSGLSALSGSSGDVRVLLAARAEGDAGAASALAVYLHRLRKGVAAMAAAAGGIDALVFTGGVGENEATIRLECCDGLAFLGIGIDPERNAGAAADDLDVTASRSPVRVLVVHAREDLEMVRQARRVLSSSPAGA